MELQQLSDTRWACRDKAQKDLQRNLKAILKLLDDIGDSDPPNLARGDAQMYRNAINFMFILCLEIATPVFEVTAVASESLQEEHLHPSTAYKVNDGVLHTLQTMRSEEKFGEIFGCASEKAESQHPRTYLSLCGEEQLSDLLLPAIEKDTKINHSEVINIFKDMATRRMLL